MVELPLYSFPLEVPADILTHPVGISLTHPVGISLTHPVGISLTHPVGISRDLHSIGSELNPVKVKTKSFGEELFRFPAMDK